MRRERRRRAFRLTLSHAAVGVAEAKPVSGGGAAPSHSPRLQSHAQIRRGQANFLPTSVVGLVFGRKEQSPARNRRNEAFTF
jgi:hypothetical protein